MANNDYFLNFNPVTKETWREQVIKELKGRSFDKILWKSDEDISMEPLLTLEERSRVVDAFPTYRLKENQRSWVILQEHQGVDANTNQRMLLGLNQGVQGLIINPVDSLDGYRILLKDIKIPWIKIYLQTKEGSVDMKIFMSFVTEQNVNKEDWQGGLWYDPLLQLAINGQWVKNEEEDWLAVKQTAKMGLDLPNFQTIQVDGATYGDRGASIVNELAYTLASYHEYMLQLTESGLNEKDVLETIGVRLSIGRSYYLELAKVKAFRMLHAHLLQSYDLEAVDVKITSRSSKFALAPVDSYNNLLRLTTHAMAAGIGGADEILLSTFDQKETAFSQRMSINIQHLLLEESFLTHGVDVSSGSYAIEKLISDIAYKAWEKFQEIEVAGGWTQSVLQGLLQKDIYEDARKKISKMESGETKWIGVNAFKNAEGQQWKSIEINKSRGDVCEKLCVITHQFV